MILFKRISYKNFLSTGNQPIEVALDMSQTTLVVGTNGTGKSTLLDALCFVLFNRPFRIIKKEQMVNTINGGDCLVECEFDVGTKNYIVRRGIKPNLFEIFCDGKLINQDANNVDYQKYLESNIMKLNYRSFIQVVLLGSSSYEPFMKMKPRYRREVVEEILDIRVFGLMDLILRSQQSDLQKKLTEVRHQCELIKTKYETEAKYLKTLEAKGNDNQRAQQNKLEENNKNRLEYETKLQKLNEQIAVSQNELSGQDVVQKKLKELEKYETKIEQNLDTHKKTLKFFKENDTCPVCTQSIDKTFKEEKCNHETTTISKLESGLSQLVEELTKQEEKLTAFGKVSNKIQDMNVNLAKITASLESLKKHSDQIQQEISISENRDTDIESIKQSLSDMSADLGVADANLTDVQEEKDYVDILREILNDKGAKAQIIRKYVPIMNALINKYLQSMDFYISFNLDEEFNETVKSRFRDTFNYNNFSEGEKMRIDLALLFTWRDIARMKNSTNTNLLILDEIFDSSLDGQGTDDFFKIIKTLEKENIFIISHKGDILFDKFTNIIKFEKHQNFTQLGTI
ncbi:putative chromosome partition protein [Pelagibacter phage Mosig EXVC030M]|nr:putative chromosome partition protein [Pelagibacter phage Mosig EXVC030M]